MELSAFAHMTKRDIKVVQPGLVYVIEWRAGAQVEASALGSGSTGSGSTGSRETGSGSGSTLGVTTAEGDAQLQSPRRRSPRTPAASGSTSTSTSGSGSTSGATAKVVRRVKTGRGYYVVEEVSSDEEEGEEEGGDGDGEKKGEREREEEEEGGGPTVYVA